MTTPTYFMQGVVMLAVYTIFTNNTAHIGEQGNLQDVGHVPTFDSHEPALVSHHLDMSGVVPGGESADYVSVAALPGIPAVPQKVAKKLLGGEYVDMAEMRPDAWRMEELMYAGQSDTPSCPAGSRGANRKRPVTDIVTWMECFSVMAAIITAKASERAPHLFAYQRLIVRASQSFEGLAWVSYDAQFRRKASLTRSWEWGTPDSPLYNDSTNASQGGRSQSYIVVFAYQTATSTGHASSPATPNQVGLSPGPAGGDYPYSTAPQGRRPDTTGAGKRVVELCGKFNKFSGNACNFNDCRFAHICSRCMVAPHPASRCPVGGRAQGNSYNQQRYPLLPHPQV